MANLPIFTDSLVDKAADLLRFDRYLGPLEDILTNPSSVTPFTIGVFGSWGSGKSTLLEMLANEGVKYGVE